MHSIQCKFVVGIMNKKLIITRYASTLHGVRTVTQYYNSVLLRALLSFPEHSPTYM